MARFLLWSSTDERFPPHEEVTMLSTRTLTTFGCLFLAVVLHGCNSGGGAGAGFTTVQGPTMVAPAWPEGGELAVLETGAFHARLAWPPAVDDTPVVGYEVNSGDVQAWVEGTSHLLTNPGPDVRVVAVDEDGRRSPALEVGLHGDAGGSPLVVPSLSALP